MSSGERTLPLVSICDAIACRITWLDKVSAHLLSPFVCQKPAQQHNNKCFQAASSMCGSCCASVQSSFLLC